MSRHTLSLRGATKGSDAAIHRASRDAFGFWRFAYWFSVDRYGLRPREEKARECPAHSPVIARSDQRERRGNPSCLEIRVRRCGSLPGSQWIATG